MLVLELYLIAGKRSNPQTRTGLKVFATILDQVYETGKKVAQDFQETMSIVFAQYLPQWNYTVKPQSS